MKKKIYVITMLASLLLSSGCKDREPVTYEPAGQEDNGTYATGSDVNEEYVPSIAEDIGAPDHWDAKITQAGSNVDIVINVDVSIPEVSSMKVVPATYMKYDVEDKKRILSFLADDKIYYGDKEHYPKSMLEQEVSKCNALVDVYKNSVPGDSYEDRAQYEAEYAEAQENLDMMRQFYDAAVDEWTVAESFEGDVFRIIRFGTPCFVSFKDNIGIGNLEMSSIEQDPCKPDSEEVAGKAISEDEAKEAAIKFLSELSMEDFVVGKIEDITNIYDDFDEEELSSYAKNTEPGYIVTFYRTLESVPIDRDYHENAIEHNGGDATYADIEAVTESGYIPRDTAEYITVIVKECGVTQMYHASAKELYYDNTEEAKLLGFDKIQSSIENVLVNDDTYTSTYYSEPLVLEYLPIRSNEDYTRFMVIPVWKLSAKSDNNMTVFINALDGSYINTDELLMIDNGK